MKQFYQLISYAVHEVIRCLLSYVEDSYCYCKIDQGPKILLLWIRVLKCVDKDFHVGYEWLDFRHSDVECPYLFCVR